MNCCAGCREPIRDKFIFSVIDLHWHQDCVQCADCSLKLSERCYEIAGRLYCKPDYWRRFGPKCSACRESIERSEVVQRIKGNRVFHLRCFACSSCNKQLRAGEQLHLIGGKRLLCEQDFGQLSAGAGATAGHPFDERASDSSDGAANLDELSEKLAEQEQEQEQEEREDELLEEREQANAGLDDELNGSEKRRGPRTTIKPKQLEVLRRAFESAPKPSRHIREQLAEETGLNMRVIQVWFQNRRSKERRMKNSNGSARRNFFRSSSRRLRVVGPSAAASQNAGSTAPSTPTGPAGTPTLNGGGGGQQQSLIAAVGRNAMGGAGKQKAGVGASQRQSALQQAQLSPQVMDSNQQQASGRGQHESPSEFGGSSSGGFTYFSDSSNQGDSYSMGAASQPPNAGQPANTSQYLPTTTNHPTNGQLADPGSGGHALLTLGSPAGETNGPVGANPKQQVSSGNGAPAQQYLGSTPQLAKSTPPPQLMGGPPHPHMMHAAHHHHSSHGLHSAIQQPMMAVASPQLHPMMGGGGGHPNQHHAVNGSVGTGQMVMQQSGGMSMGPAMLGHPPVVQWVNQ